MLTPTLRITGTGANTTVEYTDEGDANAVLVEIDGEPWAVTLDEVEHIPGWQNLSALDLGRLVAGMPGGG